MTTEMEILSAVNGFYENAFGQLLQYTLAIVAFVGVVVPVIASLMQWKSLKSEKEGLERYISQELEAVKASTRADLLLELNEKIKSTEESLTARMDDRFSKLDEKLHQARANSFHLQGNTGRKSLRYASACVDFCRATEGYLLGRDEMNAQRTLRLLIKDCLPMVTKTLYESVDVEERVESLTKIIESVNENNRYTDSLRSLLAENKKAKVREDVQKTK